MNSAPAGTCTFPRKALPLSAFTAKPKEEASHQRVAGPWLAFAMLEPCDKKVSRPVLRGLRLASA
jgi:hypothetical protein